MTTQSWKTEWYTDPADCKTDLDAAEQGLKKYIGARKENLEKHRLVSHQGSLFDGKGKGQPSITFGNNQCAFCKLYWEGEAEKCGECLIIADINTCYSFMHPYRVFNITCNPEPMITLLTTIRDNLLKDPAYYQKKENTT